MDDGRFETIATVDLGDGGLVQAELIHAKYWRTPLGCVHTTASNPESP